MGILTKGDTIGIVACSNGIKQESAIKINSLVQKLNSLGLTVRISPYIFKKSDTISNGTGLERANALMDFFSDQKIKAIFDISGGDLANETLEYLDFDYIRDNAKPFFGYSDLSVVLNAIYARSGIATYNYQIQNLIGKFQEEQITNFQNTLMSDKNELTELKYKWVQGSTMEGIVIGGNVRCFLKLAGTDYMPDFDNKILLLESLGGDAYKMVTYLTQYKHLGAFTKINGILLGTFTEMEREKYKPNIVDIAREIIADFDIPICKTENIGHGQDSKCIAIGKKIRIGAY